MDVAGDWMHDPLYGSRTDSRWHWKKALIDTPGHLVAQGQDVSEEFEEVGFVVGDASGQQPAAALVDRNAVVVGFTCVDAGPDQCHVVPPCGVVLVPATDDLAVDSLLSDHSQFLIGSRVVVGHRAANH